MTTLARVIEKGTNGRGGRIRTGDLLNPIQVRYRTALRPDEAHASIRLHPLQEKERAVGRSLEIRVRHRDGQQAAQRDSSELAGGPQTETVRQVVVHHACHQVEPQ